MRRMQKRYQVSFVFSSHDREVIGAADDTIFLKDGVIHSVHRRAAPPAAAPTEPGADLDEA